MRRRAGSTAVAAILALLVVLAPAGFASAKPAKPLRAADPLGGKTVLLMSGAFGPGSYRAFLREVARARPDIVLLESPGGVLGEALYIGDEIRRRGLNTLVAANGHCASACAVVFLSGRVKYAGSGSFIGLHAASDLEGRMDRRATDLMAQYLRSVGVGPNTLKRMAATAPSRISWLSRAERKALKIRSFPPG